jgi:hypothetical protein
MKPTVFGPMGTPLMTEEHPQKLMVNNARTRTDNMPGSLDLPFTW